MLSINVTTNWELLPISHKQYVSMKNNSTSPIYLSTDRVNQTILPIGGTIAEPNNFIFVRSIVDNVELTFTYVDTVTQSSSPGGATENTLSNVKISIDAVKTAVDSNTASSAGTTAAINSQKNALLAALAPLATEATLSALGTSIKGTNNKTLSDIVTSLTPLLNGATEVTLQAVNTKLGQVNTDNALMKSSLSLLQADVATLVGRVFNNHTTQRVSPSTTVIIPAGAWRTVSVLYIPTTIGSTINGASFDGMSLTSNLTSYEGSYSVTTNTTTLLNITSGNCDVFITRTF